MMNTLSNVELPHEHVLSEHGFLAVPALPFIASTMTTMVWCNAMPIMSEMPMARMPIRGQTWWGSAVPSIGMWTAMMTATMLPPLLPTLRQYCDTLHLAGKPNIDTQTALAGAGYFAVWTLIGVMVFALGAALTQLEMTRFAVARMAPSTRDAAVLAADALQFSAWKMRQCTQYRIAQASGCVWRFGLDLGVRCAASYTGLTVILSVTGVTDACATVIVSMVITLECLAPAGQHMARCISAAVTGAGSLLMLRTTLS